MVLASSGTTSSVSASSTAWLDGDGQQCAGRWLWVEYRGCVAGGAVVLGVAGWGGGILGGAAAAVMGGWFVAGWAAGTAVLAAHSGGLVFENGAGLGGYSLLVEWSG